MLMKTLLTTPSHEEALRLQLTLGSYGIDVFINGEHALHNSQYRGLVYMTITVQDRDYQKALEITKEHHSSFLPKAESCLCKACEGKNPPFRYDTARLSLLKKIYILIRVNLGCLSFCPNCGKLH